MKKFDWPLLAIFSLIVAFLLGFSALSGCQTLEVVKTMALTEAEALVEYTEVANKSIAADPELSDKDKEYWTERGAKLNRNLDLILKLLGVKVDDSKADRDGAPGTP